MDRPFFSYLKKAEAESRKEEEKALNLELDYELACLHEAIQSNDQKEIDKSKKRLKEVQEELEVLKSGENK